MGFREDNIVGVDTRYAEDKIGKIAQAVTDCYEAGFTNLAVMIGGVVKAADIEGSIGRLVSAQTRDDFATRIRQLAALNKQLLGNGVQASSIEQLPISKIDLDFYIDWAGIPQKQQAAKRIEILAAITRLRGVKGYGEIQFEFTLRSIDGDFVPFASDESQRILNEMLDDGQFALVA